MNTSKIIKAIVNARGQVTTAQTIKENYGIILKIEGAELPEVYQVDFCNSGDTRTITMVGNADGVLIPKQFIDTGKDIDAYLYYVGDGFGKTVYQFHIPNKYRPDRTDEQPTPEEQSVIDQTIAALNDAVESTQEAQEAIENMSVSAQTLAEDSSATVTKTESEGVVHLEFGIPKGATGDTPNITASKTGKTTSIYVDGSEVAQIEDGIDGDDGYSPTASVTKSGKTTTITITDKNGTTTAQVEDGTDGTDGVSPTVTITPITGGHRITITDKDGEHSADVMDGDDYVLTEQDKADIADIAEADLTPTILNAFPTDIASGSIASFSDGADNLPLKSLVVNINPVQDLHGQESPYPAGGGKNLLDPSKISIFGSDASHYNIHVEYHDGVFTFTGTASSTSGNAAFNFFEYADASLSGKSYVVQYFEKTGIGTVKNVYGFRTESERMCAIVLDLSTNQTVDFSIKVSVAETLQSSYAPYENICPISGRTGANVTRTGKNLIDIPASVTKDGITFTNDSDGYVTASPSSGDPRSWGKNNAQFLVNLAPGNYKFVIKLKTPSASQYSGWEIYSPTGVKIAGSSGGKFQADEVAAFTASTYGTYYIMAKIHSSAARFMVVKDGADTSNYEPYTGQTIPISWQTEAGTVYGGTLDLVSGLLTINRTTVNTTWGSGINATNLGYVTRKRFNLDNPSKKYYTDAANDLKSNVIGQYNTLYSGDYVHMYLASTTHIWAYMPSNTAADTVMQFSYTLETPVTYQLTPTEVATLLGDNTIWADTGDTEVEYRANTKLYIERLTAPDSADMVADSNIVSGQYFMVGNSLYKATANIANGGAIVVGTNCIRKSLPEALNEINA